MCVCVCVCVCRSDVVKVYPTLALNFKRKEILRKGSPTQ